MSMSTFIGLTRLGSHPGTHAFADFTPFFNRLKRIQFTLIAVPCLALLRRLSPFVQNSSLPGAAAATAPCSTLSLAPSLPLLDPAAPDLHGSTTTSSSPYITIQSDPALRSSARSPPQHDTATPHQSDRIRATAPGMEAAAELALRLRAAANGRLARYEPLALVAAPLLALLAARWVHAAASAVADRGLVAIAIAAVKLLPGVSSYIAAEKKKVVDKMQSGGTSSKNNRRAELPTIGLGEEVIKDLETLKAKDVEWQGKCSGTVYITGSESEGHFELINKAYSMFSHTNPLHQDVFKSVANMEAEVVAMTAALLGSKEKSSGGQICGNMTSGGTESILLAVKTSRDYMRSKKGITKPEMIIAESAHSAYDKAAEYFNIKVRRVPVNKEFLADVKGFKRCINGNTIMMVGSAPGFPHGLIDPIEELGELASRYDICLHVDLCLGGFVLPFARKLGYPIPPFDFSVKGVTSISSDVHKYGLAPKGTSVVLYRNHEIRKHQFVAVTEWTGGLYISPTIAGSRPGGLIAGAWAAMMSLGLNGYLDSTSRIMEVSKKIQRGIEEIPGLFLIGKPDMTVVAFGSDVVDIFEVNDIMSSKGWHLNALQRPNSLHICVTLQHTTIYGEFLKDLQDSVNTVKANPGPISGGMAPIYGAAGKMPDRGTVRELLVEFMDSSC